jgi:ABC-type transporter Mla subunit MlaD
MARIKDLLNGKEIPQTLQNVEQTTAEAKNIISGPEVKRFVQNLPAITDDLKKTTARLDQILANPDLDKAIKGTTNLGPALVDLRRMLRDLNAIISTNKAEIDMLITDLSRASANTAELTDDAKRNPSRTIFGEAPPHDGGR